MNNFIKKVILESEENDFFKPKGLEARKKKRKEKLAKFKEEIKDFLNKLPEPYATETIKNIGDKDLEVYLDDVDELPVQDVGDALQMAFNWYETKQGNDYWLNVYSKYKNW